MFRNTNSVILCSRCAHRKWLTSYLGNCHVRTWTLRQSHLSQYIVLIHLWWPPSLLGRTCMATERGKKRWDVVDGWRTLDTPFKGTVLPVVWHMSGLHLNITLGLRAHTHTHTSCVPSGPLRHILAKTPCGQHRPCADERADSPPSHPLHSSCSQLLSLSPHYNFFIHVLSFLLPFFSSSRLFFRSPFHTIASSYCNT